MELSDLHASGLGLIAPPVHGLGNARGHFWKGLIQWAASPCLHLQGLFASVGKYAGRTVVQHRS